MAYRRRSFRRRRGVSRKRIAAVTRRVINSQLEKKFFNKTLYSGIPANTTWLMDSAIAGLQQGTTASTRLGNKVKLVRIEFSIAINPTSNPAMLSSGSKCRVILYHNRQTNGVQTDGATLFDANTILSLRNVPNMPKLSVLKDYVHNMSVLTVNPSTAAPMSSGPPIQFKWVIHPKQVISFITNATDITAMLTHDYGIGFCADDAGCCEVSVLTKLVFCDV